jgi:predicted Zn finger-like uncharacterized protein
MRLICPNCDAQYEVPYDVIPEAGRDVQCSDCGHTWFQEAVSALPRPERKPVPPEVASILREEAELERRAREEERQALEVQEEMPLAEPAADPAPAPEQPDPAANPFASHSFEDEPEETEAERRSREARNRLARLRGYEEDEKSAAEAAASASRRDQLPDVDAINKTLEQTDDKPKRSKDYDYDPALFLKRERRAAGFRLGMTLIIVAGVLLTATYFLTPELTRALPMAQPYLDGYTAAVDLARLWVSDQAQELLVMVNDLTNGLISG